MPEPGTPPRLSSTPLNATQKFLANIKGAPGVWCFFGWLVFFLVFWLYTKWTHPAELCDAPTPIDSPISMRLSLFCKIVALCVFGICIFLDLASTLLQVSPKKRYLSSLVLCANTISFTVYAAMIWEIFPPWKDMDGGPLEWLHVFQWCFTTPCAIVILSSLGAPMEDKYIPDWRLTLKVCIYDELMCIAGFFGFLYPSGPISWLAVSVSCVFYFLTMQGIHDVCSLGVKEAGTTFEAASIRALEWFTFFLWAMFPLVFFLHYFGLISALEFTMARIISELIVKTVYSVSLLTGNFCLLDTIAEIRLLQLTEETDRNHKAVVHVEKMNKALQLAMMEAEASSRLSRRFVANISHELRTPLNSVIAFNSLLLDSGLSPLHQEYVKSSLTSAEALLGIINQVLEYAKVESGGSDNMKLANEPFYLSTLCDELVDIVAARVASREVMFAVDVPHDMPCLRGDKFRLRQCLINLCDNAVKFSKNVGGVVTLKAQLLEREIKDGQEMEILQVDVTDNGAGIPRDKLSLLFRPFSQVDSHFARQHGGTGLGLAITKKIIEAMKGEISCESEERKHTIFRFVIPFPLASQTTDLPPPEHAHAKLEGHVTICIPQSPHYAMLLQSYRFWGLQIRDLSYKTELSEETKQEAIRLVESGELRSGMLVTDYNMFKMLALRSDKVYSSRILVLGRFSEQIEAITNGHVDSNAFLLCPLKGSLVYGRSKYVLGSHLRHQGRPTPQPTKGVPQLKDPPAPQAVEEAGERVRVLIVEDHVVNQKVAVAMLGKVLGKNKVMVEIAENGKEGLEKATEKGHEYDLVLMDVQMPFMDGLEATRRIREWESSKVGITYYIVAMTAHASKADARDCLAAGMNRYASKPLTLSVMNDIIKEFQDWFALKKVQHGIDTK